MPIPSLYLTTDGVRAWNVARAAAYGAGIGAIAALLKTFGLTHTIDLGPGTLSQVLAASLAFALLCAGAAALRNFVARRVVWHE
jgi:hypothetical protein